MTKSAAERLYRAIQEAKSSHEKDINNLNKIAEKYKIKGILVNNSTKNEYIAWTARFMSCY